MKLKGRVTLHHTADAVVVGDQVPHHRLCTEELEGQFLGDSGESARYFAAAQIYTPGGGRFQAQVLEIYAFDDGSALAVRAEVTQTAPGSDTYTGGLTIIGGSGRHAGATGHGKLSGWSDGSNARHDIEITCVLP